MELLVALAIASILIAGLIAAFQTTQRSAAIGEAREHIYQNARVALDLMAKDIKNAYIDNRNRDLILVSADGLGGRANSILEYNPSTPANFNAWVLGLGNAQTPHGIDPTGTDVFNLYADETFGSPTYTILSIKAIDNIYTLSPGPPDRLDFTCFTGNFPGATGSDSKLAEVRYIITTETFVDHTDNDYDTFTDGNDSDIGGVTVALPVGDLIPMARSEDFHPVTRKINALSLFHLRRAIDPTPDKNPFSRFGLPVCTNSACTTPPCCPPAAFSPLDPQGRYPSRDFSDWDSTSNGENIGSYIYDLQFEFYGKIAIALKSNGSPEVWGVGWGYQDVRGEDVGTDCGGTLASGDDGAFAVQSGSSVSATEGSATVTGTATTWPSTLAGGLFIPWPSGTTTLDISLPTSQVYSIVSVDNATQKLTLDRPYSGPFTSTGPPRAYSGAYRIIEPTQANGMLDGVGTAYSEDTGSDGIMHNQPPGTNGDPLDDIAVIGSPSGIPNNVSDNDGVTAESSIGEGNHRLDSRVMGIWDSRSPDPRNPRSAAELDGVDSDGDAEGTPAGTGIAYNGADDDLDGAIDDRAGGVGGANFSAYATAEGDDLGTLGIDEGNDLLDDDNNDSTTGDDGIVDDRFYEPWGKGEGVDEPDEANPNDDSLPKAVRITIAVQDPQQTLKPVVLSTTVWLSTAR
ncbi:MAG: hypothetical protein Kow0099_22330 [Candidatus Abyssubacteria bacterium]